MSVSKFVHYFSSNPAAFGFWSLTPPDNITLTSANRKADQSPSDLQTGFGAAAHATLDTEHLISHLRVALLDTHSPLPDSEGGILPVSEVCEWLLRVHYILESAVSKWCGYFTHILAHVFNSVSWASQFPFLCNVRGVIPPSEACLYGCINWSLAQAHQQSSKGLSQFFPPKRGDKTRPWIWFHFMMQKRPVPWSSGPSLFQKPHLESENEAHPGGKKSAGGNVSTSSTDTRRKGVCGCQHTWCVLVLSLLIMFICSFSDWYVFQIFGSMEKHYI